MSTDITWQQLQNSESAPLPDGDEIECQEKESSEKDSFQLTLSTIKKVVWWKSATLKDKNGNFVSKLETQDERHGPYTMFVKNSDLQTLTLYLGKAKALGIKHDDFYRVLDLESKKGKHIELTWRKN
jgi:hypothetical protein